MLAHSLFSASHKTNMGKESQVITRNSKPSILPTGALFLSNYTLNVQYATVWIYSNLELFCPLENMLEKLMSCDNKSVNLLAAIIMMINVLHYVIYLKPHNCFQLLRCEHFWFNIIVFIKYGTSAWMCLLYMFICK